MSWLDYTIFSSESLLQMRNLPASNATHLPSSCDEELADEADEPPDSRPFPSSYRQPSFSDGEFSKHIIRQTPPTESLLTRALLTSPNLVPVDRVPTQNSHKGMSNVSIWSNASTAELTSDGFTSPSRANTPSPPLPLFLSGIHSILQSPKTKSMMNGPRKVEIVSEKQEEPLGRKRCITFACTDSQPLSRRPSNDGNKSSELEKSDAPKVTTPPKRSCALTFVCTQREKKTESRPIRSPEQKYTTSRPAASGRIHIKQTEQLYDSEGMAESWTNQPIDKSRLLKVDDVLKKERDIRKLSEEVEAEVLQDEEDEDEDEAVAAGIPAAYEHDSDTDDSDMDDEEDIEGEDDLEDDDEDDEDDEEEYDNESGNETDNEEGFASGDDSDDDQLFYGPHPPHVYNDLTRPLWCRSISETSMESPTKRGFSAPRRIRSPTPVLPDSTDFVCGTLDEDKEVEQAYLSCMEERKRSKHKPTPQDIDPSFPTSDPEDSDDDQPRQKKTHSRTGSSSEGGRTGRKRSETAIKGSPRARVHSPAPVRRTITSRATSPAPRRSRAVSPAPARRNRQAQFNTGRPVVRTRSLPRTAACARRTGGKSSRVTSAATSPQKSATRPMVIRRGAMDIVKGLEKKRERRRARLARKDKAPKEDSWRSGEGVEKMRQLGLEICGKGKVRQAQWVISA